MITEANVLIVDDISENRLILEELLKNLGHKYSSVENGQEAVDLLKEKKFDLILLDIMMPVMDGYKTLEFIKNDQNLKYIPVIMITTVDEMDSIIKCIQLGAEDYLPKPFEPEILKARIDNSLTKLNYFKLEKDLLEKTLSGSIKILLEILAITNPYIYGKSSRIRRLAKMIAEDINVNDLWNIEIASMLSQVGCITIPTDILERYSMAKALSPKEREMFEKHPEVSYSLLSKLPRLEKVAEIIKYQNKNYDGTGYPHDEIKESQIPIEARILRVVLDFDLINSQDINPLKTVEKLNENKGHYDVTVMTSLEKVILGENKKEIKTVKIFQLDQTMIAAEDIATTNGMKIAGKGQEMTLTIIERIKNINRTVKVIEPIKVIITKQW